MNYHITKLNDLKSNIWKLQVIQVLRWFILAIPIIVLFYQSHGLSLQQVLILQSAFSITTLIIEIPTGYLADLGGRKFCIVFGFALWSLAWFLYSISTNFWHFFNAEILLAIGSGLVSGADSALLYDTLASIHKTDLYKKLEGRMTSLWHFSEGTAAIIGGFLATISLATPVYIQAGIIALTIPFALSLKEPPRQLLDTTSGKLKSLLKVVKHTLHENKELKWLIIYTSTISACTISVLWFLQPRFVLAGIPIQYFGVLWAVSLFIAGGTSHYSHVIENKLGQSLLIKLLMPLLALALILFGILPPVLGLLSVIIVYVIRGINIPVFKDYVNQLTTSETRATVLSISAMVFRLIFAILGPLLGYLNDTFSFQIAFICAGFLLIITYLVIQIKSKTI